MGTNNYSSLAAWALCLLRWGHQQRQSLSSVGSLSYQRWAPTKTVSYQHGLSVFSEVGTNNDSLLAAWALRLIRDGHQQLQFLSLSTLFAIFLAFVAYDFKFMYGFWCLDNRELSNFQATFIRTVLSHEQVVTRYFFPRDCWKKSLSLIWCEFRLTIAGVSKFSKINKDLLSRERYCSEKFVFLII